MKTELKFSKCSVRDLSVSIFAKFSLSKQQLLCRHDDDEKRNSKILQKLFAGKKIENFFPHSFDTF